MTSGSFKRGLVLAIATAVAVAAAALAAPANTVHIGATADGVKIKLTVAQSGNAVAFRIGRTKATCDAGQLDIEAATFKKFDTSDPGAFSDKRKSKVKSGGYLLKDTFLTTGNVGADGVSWSGTYDKRTRVFKRGERVDTCVLSTTWQAG